MNEVSTCSVCGFSTRHAIPIRDGFICGPCIRDGHVPAREDGIKPLGNFNSAPKKHTERGLEILGGDHKDEGKPRLDLLDPYAMEQMGHVLAFGANKYKDPFNYTKGIKYLKLVGSALRHIFAFIRGEDLDPESGYPHLAHGMCCLMMLLSMTQRHPELDDRCKP